MHTTFNGCPNKLGFFYSVHYSNKKFLKTNIWFRYTGKYEIKIYVFWVLLVLLLRMAAYGSIKIKAWFFKSSDFSKFMQQFYQIIILDHFICQKALILTALANEIVKIHQNWKNALILVACCQYPCGYDPNLNMANCYVYCIDS